MTYDERQLLMKEGIAWDMLMRAEDNEAPDRAEKRMEWSFLYHECEKRGLTQPL